MSIAVDGLRLCQTWKAQAAPCSLKHPLSFGEQEIGLRLCRTRKAQAAPCSLKHPLSFGEQEICAERWGESLGQLAVLGQDSLVDGEWSRGDG